MTKAIDLNLLDELFDNQKTLDNYNLFDDSILFGQQKNEINKKEESIYLNETDNDDELYSGKGRSLLSIILHISVMAIVMALVAYLYLSQF